MDEYESLSHSKWECKYHVVFIPKGRRKALYGELRKYLGEVFRKLAEQKESRIEEGASAAGPRAHVDFDSAQVRSGAGDRFYQREECDSPGTSVRRTEAEFCGAEFLGAGILRVNGRARRGLGSRVHPHAGGRGQALGSVEHVALKWPPAGGQEYRGRVSDPAQPLRAAHKLKPPALPGDTYSEYPALRAPSTSKTVFGSLGDKSLPDCLTGEFFTVRHSDRAVRAV